MIFKRLLLLGVATFAVSACAKDNSPTTPTLSAVGFVRFVNAVPDTGALDYRFVDIIEDAPSNFTQIAFRGGVNYSYQPIAVGPHHIRVFLSNSNGLAPEVVSTVVLDTTFNFSENQHYTFLHTGYARAGSTPKQKFIIFSDNFPSLAAGQFGLRAINASPTSGLVDVFASLATATGTPASTATFTNLGYGSASAYTGLAAASSTGNYRVAFTAPGSVSPFMAEALSVLTGAAAVPGNGSTTPLNATAGTRTPGSVLTSILFPPSVAGSKAASFSTPGIGFMADKKPPSAF